MILMKKICLVMLVAFFAGLSAFAEESAPVVDKNEKKSVLEKIAFKTKRLSKINENLVKVQSKLDKLNKIKAEKLTEKQKARKEKLTTRLANLNENKTRVDTNLKKLQTRKEKQDKNEKNTKV